jgi:hypothetical protein
MVVCVTPALVQPRDKGFGAQAMPDGGAGGPACMFRKHVVARP